MKIITKILANRLKPVLEEIISPVQGAFVEGRLLNHNVFLCQELMTKYARVGMSPRCTMKIDIQKVYDTLSWDFLQRVLVGLWFPNVYVHWIMTCVSTVRYSVVLNGELEGYIEGARGIRQGDPLSPFLFVIAMEYFSHLFGQLKEHSDFSFHPKCKQINLIHLCFTDDLMIFCRGDEHAIRKVRSTIDQFGEMSGLLMNAEKSEIYIGGVDE